MRNLLTSTTAVSILALTAVAAPPASAQQQQQQDVTVGGREVDVVLQRGRIALGEWDYARLYEEGTWTAEQLLDADVYGPAGDEIGEVENIVVGTDGVVAAVIAEVGGFWDIGDTHVRIPWREVEIEVAAVGAEPIVRVPVTEETVDAYDVFGGIGGEFRVVDEDDPFLPRGWRATELIDDYVTLEGGVRYGWVEDLVFDDAGRVQAVVVDAAYGRGFGPYAYPYYGYGYGFRPGYDYYGLPYGEEEVAGMEPFEYQRFEGVGEAEVEIERD